MEHITIENNIITGRFCGKMPDKKQKGVTYKKVNNFRGQVREDIRLYKDMDSWEKRPLSYLVKDKLVQVPKGKKLSKDGLSLPFCMN